VGELIDMLLTKFFNQGGAEHCAQWMSWFDKASGKQGATALRTKLKVLQVGVSLSAPLCGLPRPVQLCSLASLCSPASL
jgi:hypothetical protein